MTNEELDVDELRTELNQIKDAMGIQDRYESATSMWLLFGIAVPLAAALSQYVFTARLPGWLHALVWGGVLGGGYVVWCLLADEVDEMEVSPEGKPNLFVQFGVVYFTVLPLQAVVAAFVPELGYVEEALLVQSLIVVLIGLAYAIFGSSLAAYYVRFRDRAVFYAGGVWMVALGTAIPHVAFLRSWSHATFGGIYFVYAMTAYVVLTRT